MKNDLHFCEECGNEFEEKDMTLLPNGWGWWCEGCLDKTPGDTTGYCSMQCQIGGGCDGSC